jgi:NADPH2:quinone reductase
VSTGGLGGEAVAECEQQGAQLVALALLDLVNYAPGTYDAVLKDGARIASPTGAAGEGPGRTYVMAAPSPENLQRLGALLADGTLRVHVQATYELAEAVEALGALAGEHTQGKLAIEVRWNFPGLQ